jgi:[CysO sulfur-carrier protein]-S-L-cysteine hydrolase
MTTFPQPEKIYIKIQDWHKMICDINTRSAEEACGLLLGETNHNHYQAIEVRPTKNVLHSSVRYRMDPKEQLNAFNYMDEKGLDLVAIYHSHPDGPATPSKTDIEEAFYPEVVYLIWSRSSGEWQCRAFLIQEGSTREIQILTQQ